MIHHRKIALICVSTLALTACGGGGTNGVRGGAAKPSMSYLEIADAANRRDERLEDKYYAVPHTENEFRDKARTLNMPTSGAANYNGEVAIIIGDGVPVRYNGETEEGFPQLAGQGTLKADFGKKTLNGTISDFAAAPGHQSTGAKASFDGRIDGNRVRGSWQGNANIDGVTHEFENLINIKGHPSERTDSEGSFIGDAAAALYVDGEGVTSRGDDIQIEGFFEKNGKLGK